MKQRVALLPVLVEGGRDIFLYGLLNCFWPRTQNSPNRREVILEVFDVRGIKVEN